MVAAGQLYRFAKEFKVGDRVVTYDPRARTYLCGIIASNYTHDPSQEIDGLTNRRTVKWERETARDDLSQTAQYSLGAILTLFAVASAIEAELWADRTKKDSSGSAIQAVNEKDKFEGSRDFAPPLASVTHAQLAEQAAERIKDRIAGLAWDEMQDLVAGLLRAMGYVTQVSPPGSDRGRDIVASPDGFGFQQPRIVVEVKHRPRERIGAPDLRAFLGGRKPHENGLFVSTGGFTKEAYYEAERATIQLTLLDFEQLVSAVMANYPKLDERTKQMVPLVPIYWPL